DRDYVRSLREQAREGELRRGAILLACDLGHPLHQLDVGLEGALGEARGELPVVVRREVGARAEASGEKSAPERAVRQEPHLQLAARRDHLRLGIAGEQRVLGLQRGAGMYADRPAQGPGPGLAEPAVTALARS